MIAKVPFNYLLVTADIEELTESGLVKSSGNTVKNKQRVLVKGPGVPSDIEVGDVVVIRWDGYIVRDWTKTQSEIEKDLEYANASHVQPPVIMLDDPSIKEETFVMRINDRDIEYYMKADDLVKESKKITPKIKVEKTKIIKPN